MKCSKLYILIIILLLYNSLSAQVYLVVGNEIKIETNSNVKTENIKLIDYGNISLDENGNFIIINDIINESSSVNHANGQGTIELTGTIEQNISGTSTLKLNNNNIKLNTESAYSNINIEIPIGNLILQNGILSFDDNSNITLGSKATSTRGLINSFINGEIIKIGKDPFIFPTGDIITRNFGTDLGELEYKILGEFEIAPSIDSNVSISVKYNYSNENMPSWWNTGNNLDPTIHHVSDRENWIIKSNVDLEYIKAYWNSNNENSCTENGPHGCIHGFCFYDENNILQRDYIETNNVLTLAYHNGNKWIDMGIEPSSCSICHDEGYIKSACGLLFNNEAKATESQIVTFATANDDVPLPIELIDFFATPQKNSIDLNWSTASEFNNDRFEIEKSIENLDFVKIASVKGAGNSNILLEYNYSDNDIIPNTKYYYRLKQFDHNSHFEYSKIIIASIKDIDELFIYPNPVNDILEISTNITDFEVFIYNESLQIVVSEKNNKLFDISNLPSGQYTVVLRNSVKTIYEKIIKI